jgi:hypothetical protein
MVLFGCLLHADATAALATCAAQGRIFKKLQQRGIKRRAARPHVKRDSALRNYPSACCQGGQGATTRCRALAALATCAAVVAAF